MKRILSALLLVSFMLPLFVAPAAAGPIAVDCDVLESSLIAVDSVLPQGAFANLGELVSTALNDSTTFALLNGLLAVFSGGTISFDSPNDVMPTVAQCGLTPLLVGLVSD